MKPSQNYNLKDCPIRKNIKILGGKWSLLILLALKKRNLRFGEIKREIPDISEKMLIQTLRLLVENNFISRKDFKFVPPKVEYKILKKGKKAVKIIDIILDIEGHSR